MVGEGTFPWFAKHQLKRCFSGVLEKNITAEQRKNKTHAKDAKQMAFEGLEARMEKLLMELPVLVVPPLLLLGFQTGFVLWCFCMNDSGVDSPESPNCDDLAGEEGRVLLRTQRPPPALHGRQGHLRRRRSLRVRAELLHRPATNGKDLGFLGFLTMKDQGLGLKHGVPRLFT